MRDGWASSITRPCRFTSPRKDRKPWNWRARLPTACSAAWGCLRRVVALSLDHLRIGAERAGCSLDDIDIWTLARVNVGDDLAALTDELRMELASTAHHAFRFTLDGKLVPPEMTDAIRAVQSGYQPAIMKTLASRRTLS